MSEEIKRGWDTEQTSQKVRVLLECEKYVRNQQSCCLRRSGQIRRRITLLYNEIISLTSEMQATIVVDNDIKLNFIFAD